jgi:hypothetical protein
MVGFKGIPAYIAGKHGAIGLTRQRPFDSNILVNAASPGGFPLAGATFHIPFLPI